MKYQKTSNVASCAAVQGEIQLKKEEEECSISSTSTSTTNDKLLRVPQNKDQFTSCKLKHSASFPLLDFDEETKKVCCKVCRFGVLDLKISVPKTVQAEKSCSAFVQNGFTAFKDASKRFKVNTWLLA